MVGDAAINDTLRNAIYIVLCAMQSAPFHIAAPGEGSVIYPSDDDSTVLRTRVRLRCWDDIHINMCACG